MQDRPQVIDDGAWAHATLLLYYTSLRSSREFAIFNLLLTAQISHSILDYSTEDRRCVEHNLLPREVISYAEINFGWFTSLGVSFLFF